MIDATLRVFVTEHTTASFAFTAKSEEPNVEPVPLRWHVIAPADQPDVRPVSDTE